VFCRTSCLTEVFPENTHESGPSDTHRTRILRGRLESLRGSSRLQLARRACGRTDTVARRNGHGTASSARPHAETYATMLGKSDSQVPKFGHRVGTSPCLCRPSEPPRLCVGALSHAMVSLCPGMRVHATTYLQLGPQITGNKSQRIALNA
jgi:hypothetical protein